MRLPHPELPEFSLRTTRVLRLSYASLLIILISLTTATVLFLKSKEYLFETLFVYNATATTTAPFPVSVDPARKLIVDNPQVNPYFQAYIAGDPETPQPPTHISLMQRVTAMLTSWGWYQNLATPESRILVILPGERKEQVAKEFGDILGWNADERSAFMTMVASTTPSIADGKFLPAHYLVASDATPGSVATIINERFKDEILSRYTQNVSSQVPLAEALTVASIIEREAHTFTDMREISGIIWNRLFVGMNLQIDATVQYAKANKDGNTSWPRLTSQDKFIDSPFNTYQNAGLPPSPISSPSLSAIFAALNPIQTDCLYYFHDAQSNFHCTKTYEEHVALLKKYYGRGS